MELSSSFIESVQIRIADSTNHSISSQPDRIFFREASPASSIKAVNVGDIEAIRSENEVQFKRVIFAYASAVKRENGWLG